jgi:hypothetical protein
MQVLMKVNAPGRGGAGQKIGAGKENGHSKENIRVPEKSLLPRRMGGNQQKGAPM